MFVFNCISGFCMALADSVPGVSGGTIAFVLGFYDKFIISLRNLFFGTRAERIKSIKFLLNLGIGWITGILLSILFITSIFNSHIYEISSLFLGLLVVSIPLIIKEEQHALHGKYKYSFLLLIGIIVVCAMTYFNPAASASKGIDLAANQLTIYMAFFVFISGMIAISAMVLPGISGSTILLIFGLYAPILEAIREVFSLNFSYLPVVFIFGLGVVCGIALTIKGVKYALEHHRAQTVYIIIGLMIGSLYAVLMGPESLKTPKPPMTADTFSIIYFIIGGVLIVLLELLKHYMMTHRRNSAPDTLPQTDENQ